MDSSSDDESVEQGNRYDDADDDMQIEYHATHAELPAVPPQYEDADEDDDEEEAEAVDVEAVAVEPVRPVYGIRGKPEAMAMALAAAKIDEVKEELEAEKQHDHEDAPVQEATAIVAEPIQGDTRADFDDPVDAQATPVPEPEVKPPPKKKRKKTPAKKSPASKKSSKSGGGTGLSDLSLDDPVEPITDAEYENLVHLMDHFCKVPLLAEFSRPVTLLHPELMAAYSKIVKHPIDLGRVCRKIGRRTYQNTREAQLDMWRIFANCVKYHSHPSNKEGVPSFVSIALHLREYWNNLFQEFMLPSDAPKKAPPGKAGSAKYQKATYATREEERKKRLIVSGLTCMSTSCLKRSAEKLNVFLANQGRVDRLDQEPIFPGQDPLGSDMDADDQRDLGIVVDKLAQFRLRMLQLAAENAEYTVEQFDSDLKTCYLTDDVFENNPALKFRVRNRINRFVGKILVPINEANCRGVTQSSIWGCMAAAIWARESSKKPYWPALVLGILAPEDQKEDWHWALTERNEQRLPEALRTQLSAGKRKAEQALKRQSQGQADPQSFFLVEFLGTHEFIWVRETDIVESFEPDDDPNLKVQANKKKRSGARAGNAALVGSKKYQGAIEEAGWALEEFEMQLQDACGDMGDDEDGEDGNYSYSVLCVSDDEADDVYDDDDNGMTLSEVEEANELIATRGLIDFSVTGRKNAKKRALALKKQKMEAEKKQKLEKAKRAKSDQAKKKRKESAAAKDKEREQKKELKDLERRRKKRSREREKALKLTRKTKKKRGPEDPNPKDSEGGTLFANKRIRATAIVKGYLTRMATDEEYRSLGLQGIMSIPAAMVDSSGLLGMALAFRAAAGELSMPEESGDQERVQPWDAIEIDDTMTEKQRMDALKKQAELLENEIKRVKSATATRLKLAAEAESVREQLDEEIFKDEIVARTNPYKKKKKVVGSSSKSTDNSPEGKTDEVGRVDNDEATKAVGGEVKAEETMMVDLGPSHVADTPPRETQSAASGAVESDHD